MAKFKTLEDAQEAFNTLEKESIQKDEVIDELRKSLTAAKKEASTAGKIIVITHDKKKYKVHAGVNFKLDGKEHSTDDLKDNKELVKTLVEMGAGILTEAE